MKDQTESFNEDLSSPAKDSSLSDQIYRQIKNRIIFCHYVPGQFLTESMLAKDFAVSKTPIKAAIRMLINEGWLEAAFRCKTRVSDVTAEDIRNIYEIRLLIEGYAIDQIFHRQLALEYAGRLSEKIRIARSNADTLASFLTQERMIHNELIQVCQNRRIINVYQNVHDEMMRVSSIYYLMRDDFETMDFHSEIDFWWDRVVILFKEKNYDEAKYLISSHLRKGQNNALEALEKWNQSEYRAAK